MDNLPKKELHGQKPVVTYATKQALHQFESQSKTRPPQQSGQGGGPRGNTPGLPPMGRGGGGGPMRGPMRGPPPGPYNYPPPGKAIAWCCHSKVKIYCQPPWTPRWALHLAGLHTSLPPELQCSTGLPQAMLLALHQVLSGSVGRLLRAFHPMLPLRCLGRHELHLPPCHHRVLLQFLELM